MKIPVLTTVATLATVLIFGSGSVHAATCTVPVPYASIQAAVNTLACTTIDVAPGTYSENVTINRTLTLNGAQAGSPTAGRVSGGALESTVYGANPIGANAVFTISAAGVRIDMPSVWKPTRPAFV